MDMQDRLRHVRREIDDERMRLARPSFTRKVGRWLLWGGFAVFAVGWFPIVVPPRSIAPDTSEAYDDMLSRARAAKDGDGAIRVSVDRAGKPVQLTIADLSIVTDGAPEEKRYTAHPANLLTDERRLALSVAADHGWALTRIDAGAGLDKAGFKLGDVITAFGGRDVPAVTSVRVEGEQYPYGLGVLKACGGAAALLGLVAAGMRRARLRRLLITEEDIVHRVDEAMKRRG